jgi:hypothetical protein
MPESMTAGREYHQSFTAHLQRCSKAPLTGQSKCRL